MSLSALGRAANSVAKLISRLSTRLFPPPSPGLALASIDAGRFTAPPTSTSWPSVAELISDLHIRLAVPKRRRTIESRATRRLTRYANIVVPMMATARVVTCAACGNRHERGVVCPLCYERIRNADGRVEPADEPVDSADDAAAGGDSKRAKLWN